MNTNKTVPELLHDARSALGVIQSTAELELMSEGLASPTASSLQQIIEQVRSLSATLTEIGESSQKE